MAKKPTARASASATAPAPAPDPALWHNVLHITTKPRTDIPPPPAYSPGAGKFWTWMPQTKRYCAANIPVSGTGSNGSTLVDDECDNFFANKLKSPPPHSELESPPPHSELESPPPHLESETESDATPKSNNMSPKEDQPKEESKGDESKEDEKKEDETKEDETKEVESKGSTAETKENESKEAETKQEESKETKDMTPKTVHTPTSKDAGTPGSQLTKVSELTDGSKSLMGPLDMDASKAVLDEKFELLDLDKAATGNDGTTVDDGTAANKGM